MASGYVTENGALFSNRLRRAVEIPLPTRERGGLVRVGALPNPRPLLVGETSYASPTHPPAPSQ
jgi:hypothetical protein